MTNNEHESLASRANEEFTGLPNGVRQLGPYKLLREIGRGAMGTVYEAEHINLKRCVALKVLPNELAASAHRYARFQREMEAIGRLEHPNIVLATDAGQIDGICYIAMQLLQGVDLSKVLSDLGTLSVPVACEMVRQVALGLEEINSHGMIHRDIKPSNLLLATNGEVKILDLGIASLRQSTGCGDNLTITGSFLGTPDYVAPEQIDGQVEIDIRADIYSLGCTLYHLIGGITPFSGPEYDSLPAKLLGHVEREPEPLNAAALGIPPGVLDVLSRMIAKDRDQRFSSPSEVAAALQEFCDAASLDMLAASFGSSNRSKAKPLNAEVIATLADTHTLRINNRRWRIRLAAAGSLGLALALVAGYIVLAAIDHGKKKSASTQQLVDDQQHSAEQQLDATRSIGEDTHAIRDSTDEIAKQATALNSTVGGMAQDTKLVVENTGQIVQSLEELQASFSQVVDKLNADPQSPTEWYANALIHSKSGNALEARRAFLEFLKFNLNVIDPYQNFSVLLRVQEGVAGARETFTALPGDRGLPARRLVEITLYPEEERQASLRELIAQEPNFTPAYLELAKSQGDDFGGFLSLRELLERKTTIEKYLQQHADGQLLRFYLDQTQAAADVATAKQHLQRSPNVTQEMLDNPIKLAFIGNGETFHVHLSLAELAENISYRLPAEAVFTLFDPPAPPPEGTFAMLNGAFAKNVIRNQSLSISKIFELPDGVPAGDIEVKYEDRNGVACGPFKIKFEPEQIRLEHALYLVRGENGTNKIFSEPVHIDWVKIRERWRESEPDELSFYDLLDSWRAIESVRYGVNVEVPNLELRIPKSDAEANDEEIATILVSEHVQFVTLQATFVDGYTTVVHRYENKRR